MKTFNDSKIFYAVPVWKTFAVFVLVFLVPAFSLAQTGKPVETSRSSTVTLTAPQSEDSFSFLIFADRTTGKPEDISILKDAVLDTNRLAPAFVMNIGDMVQGYNATEQWLEQMKEFKDVMNGLTCPWYPTPGNHDVYAGKHAKDLPKGQHEKEYEEHFGPLWYAFEYKNYWFIVLFTDEGNLETGEKAFNKPECQVMSDAQFDWLKSILKKANSADGIFVFQHQPRWMNGRYGDDWKKVHTEFVKAGNVKAVFGGHIHRMTCSEKDGIRYITLAATGGKLDRIDPEAGTIHEIHHVSVRKNKHPEITAFSVNSTLDITVIPSKTETPDNRPAPKPQEKQQEEKIIPATAL